MPKETAPGNVSGGQLKRVNIGLELAAAPSLLLLDEPTSGLDSTASIEVCTALSNLSRLGISVVMVIHQPRFSLFQLFDEIFLLARGGRTIFQGSPREAVGYFIDRGFELCFF